MTTASHRIRRATLDDLPRLKVLWASMQFRTEDLEKRLTEFQVAEAADGKILGALGVQILRPHGWLHSEAFHDFTLADDLRPLFLERLRALAANHGVFRLWTREKAPFWARQGFGPAGTEVLKKLPEAWAGAGSDWLTLQLKDEDAIVSLEKEMTLFMQSEKQRTERALDRVRLLKRTATLLAVLFAVLVLSMVLYLIRKNPSAILPKH